VALEVHLEVTQPYHGVGGVLLYDVGHRFELPAVLPEGIWVAPVIEDVADEPAPAVEPAPAKPPAPVPAPAAKAG